MTRANHYDVVIIGGGVVGTTLACALRQARLRVALIESMSAQQRHDDNRYDLRVSALTSASQRLFAVLQVWPQMQAQRVSPFRQMHVWDSRGRGEVSFDSADLGEPVLGYIVENRVITQALFDAVQAVPNLDVFMGTRCDVVTRQSDHWRLSLSDKQQLSACLVVGADGSHSWLRQQTGIPARGWDYDQSAVVTYVKTNAPHQETAWQCFLPSGPLAFLPLTDGYSSIVWSTHHEQAEHLCRIDAARFATELAEAFSHRLGEIESIGPRARYPLRCLLAERYVAPGLALIGDAAHTLHPLAGQGVNLGLADAACLAEILVNAQQQRRVVGSYAVLRRYERWRRAANLPMIAAVEGFERLFGSPNRFISGLRNLGMMGFDRLPVLKHQVIEFAMGQRGDLPKLTRGEPL